MNSNTILLTAIAVLSSTSSVLAGPGLDHWTRKQVAVVESSKPAAATSAACSDSRVVPVYELRQDWPNGKGTRRFVKVGEKVVCKQCDTPATVMRPSGHNGKGPMQPVTLSASHDCTVNCPKT